MKMKTNQAIAALNTISPGWTEARPGGLLCNPNAGGGIIDFEIVSGEWFVIFNDRRDTLVGYETREDAIEAFALASLASQLKTKLHLTRVLHVAVSGANVDPAELEADLEMVLPEWGCANLRDGITVDAETLREHFHDHATTKSLLADDWHANVIPFLQAVTALKPRPNEYFFHYD